VVKDNPVIDYAEHIVLPAMGSLEVKRPPRYGGALKIGSPAELRKLYAAGELHPADLKAAVTSAVVELLAPVRQYFEEHPEAKPSKPSPVL
jgi:tyrosyl-tRNA synthetase